MPNFSYKPAAVRLLLVLCLVITTYLSLTPQPDQLPNVAFADKWAHGLTYLLLAFMADASWPARGFDSRKWGTLLAYGLMIELIQSQIPNRGYSALPTWRPTRQRSRPPAFCFCRHFARADS